MKVFKELDPIIPSILDSSGYTEEEIVKDLVEQQKNYGISKFILDFPDRGFRSEKSFPSLDFFAKGAERFVRIKAAVEPYGIELGWWLSGSVFFGLDGSFEKMIKADGSARSHILQIAHQGVGEIA